MKDLKNVKFILSSTFILIIATLVIGSFTNNQLLTYLMLAFFAIFAAVYFCFWRCPNCKKHLGKMIVHRCKHCGHEID
ncbi:MAG: hypothetical protein IJN59_02665 [Oscillospiraceae bacterium]|nr:hypothetical protein [Oscillospiraceae bacterium]